MALGRRQVQRDRHTTESLGPRGAKKVDQSSPGLFEALGVGRYHLIETLRKLGEAFDSIYHKEESMVVLRRRDLSVLPDM